MWGLIFAVIIIAALGGFVYLCSRVYRFSFWEKILPKRLPRMAVSCVPVVLALLVLSLSLGIMNAIIALLVLIAFWLLSDLAVWIIGRVRRKKFVRNWAAVPAVLASVIYLAVGWGLAHHVWITEYTVQTEKEVGSLRVALFADSHVGATFDGEGFAEQMTRIQEQNPDIVIIAGDFVDDDTSKADMVTACKALGTLQTTYGVFFAFGNHDKGYYDSRDYTGDDLKAELFANGVTVLEDEAVLVDNRFYIVGRQDRSEIERGEGRAEISDLIAPLDPSKFFLIVDHQPNDYEKESEAGADLVLSGHTHGGQLFPVTYVGEWFGANDRTYGYERRGNSQFIVTSGISDWAIAFKTGTRSEFVMIDVQGK